MSTKNNNRDEAADSHPIPSQAEGEDIGEDRDAGDRPRPSQAEGEEETVDESLRQHE